MLANSQVSDISDSTLKKKIVALLIKSSSQHSNNTEELTSLIKQISQNSSTLKDHYSVLKIVLTLPLIEKYQKDNLPNKGEFKMLIKEQEKLIKQIDSLSMQN